MHLNMYVACTECSIQCDTVMCYVSQKSLKDYRYLLFVVVVFAWNTTRAHSLLKAYEITIDYIKLLLCRVVETWIR